MTAEDWVRDALISNATVTGEVAALKIQPWPISQKTALPYIALFRLPANHEHNMSGAAGLARVRVQVDVFAATKAEVDRIAEKVRVALDGLTGTRGGLVVQQCHLKSDNTEYVDKEDEGGGYIRRVSHDYEVWYEEAIPTH